MKTLKSELNEIKISYKTKGTKSNPITCSADAAKILRKHFPVDIEHREAAMSLFLNRANEVIGFFVISIGGLSGTTMDPKTIFQTALKCNAAGIIISHNHPSGKLKPSQADINCTNKIVEIGKFLDLPLLDHVILTDENFYSFADEGKL